MRNRWIYRLYNAAVLLLLPLIGLWIFLRWRKRVMAHGFERWSERWGHLSEAQCRQVAEFPSWWWVHAVSLGEIKAIESFLKKAPAHANVRLVVSVVTPEAIRYATEQRLADLVIAAPIDLPWIARRLFRIVRPACFISVESEFWPNMIREAKRSGAMVALINGRLSQRSFRSYQRLRYIMAALWESFDLWAVRQDQDAERFRALGVPSERVIVSGNLKYDVPLPARRSTVSQKSHAPVLVLGSTREGEEHELLPAIDIVRKRWPALTVIWAPRHVERVAEVEALLKGIGQEVTRKTKLPVSGRVAGSDILWDSVGDLLDAYRQADVAVIGGSFVAKGGQNPIEPASLEVPVVFGPSMDNFYGIAERLVNDGGAAQVSIGDLSGCLEELLADPEKRFLMGAKARQVVEDAQGATERTLRLLEARLPKKHG